MTWTHAAMITPSPTNKGIQFKSRGGSLLMWWWYCSSKKPHRCLHHTHSLLWEISTCASLHSLILFCIDIIYVFMGRLMLYCLISHCQMYSTHPANIISDSMTVAAWRLHWISQFTSCTATSIPIALFPLCFSFYFSSTAFCLSNYGIPMLSHTRNFWLQSNFLEVV